MPEDPQRINVLALVNQQPIGRYQLLITALCAAVVFMDGFDAQAIGYVAPALSRAWQLKPGALGPAFAVSLVGLTIGALIAGPVADRLGRKPVILFCALLFGVCTLLTVTSDSLDTLIAWRFVTGLGLGGAMPNAIAITSEYSPDRSRATMVMVMFIGFSLGSALGGVLAAQLVPAYGWTIVFWVGGVLPLILFVVLVFLLPESIRLLALRGDRERDRIAAIVRKIDPSRPYASGTTFVAPEEHPSGFTVRHLFSEGRALGTVLLWAMFFMNLLDLYFLANWLPTVINNAGISERLAVITTTMLQVGGVLGTLVLARLIDRFRPYRVLGATYCMAAVCLMAIALGGSSIGFIMPAVFATGFCVVGSQIGANALAALYYPTYVRATGVGWALGIGRIGSIMGPLVGGMLLMRNVETMWLFLIAAIPAFISAAAVITMGRLTADPPGRTALGAAPAH